MNISNLQMTRIQPRSCILIPIVLIAAGCAAPPPVKQSDNSASYPTARIMTTSEIHELYRDRSWQWENGVGYMGAAQQFSAWSGNEAEKTWAEGRWIITNSGRMCLDATWHTADDTYPDKTCFSHRIYNGTVYQKREPDGEWYIFRHSPPRADDEAGKLIPGDQVSEELVNLKTALAADQSPAQ